MQINSRLRYDMNGRVGEFYHTHPETDPTALQVVARLTELNTRVETLSQLQRSSVTIAAAAVSQKTQLRFDIENGLAGLFGIAQVASATHPEIAVHRRRIRPHASEVTLLTAARVAVAEALADKDRLTPFGLSDAMLTALSADIAAYSAELARHRNAMATQVGATADLKAVLIDVMKVVKNLDAINKTRFKDDRELMAAWKSARNVAWRIDEPVAPDITPTTPAEDKVSAA